MDEGGEDSRALELEAIAAIYPEIVLDPESDFKASLELPVCPITPVKAVFRQVAGQPDAITIPLQDQGGENEGEQDISYISHLPPIHLGIELPEDYPSTKPPIFSLRTEPSWLPRSTIARLIDDGEKLWEESGRDLIVYSYIDQLRDAAEEVFSARDNKSGVVVLPDDLKIALLDFDRRGKRQKFEEGTFECEVCLEPKKGSVCYQLQSCGHVFCVPCLQGFYTSCITEGDVDSVKCLAFGCGKDPAPEDAVATAPRKNKDKALSPAELLDIPIELEIVQRYSRLKRKRQLELDKTTTYCPRQWCQGAARSKRHPKPVNIIHDDIDAAEDEDAPAPFDPLGTFDQLPPMSQRLAVCEDCAYAFCRVCFKGWHGEWERCFPRGNKGLTGEIEPTEEEKATMVYIRDYTSKCPTCDAVCQKSMGCNHMICFQCDTHFCYLCSMWLGPNPYKHFNTEGSYCYQKLWELEGGDGERRRAPRPQENEANADAEGGDGDEDAQQPQPPPAPRVIPPPPPANNPQRQRAQHQGGVNGGNQVNGQPAPGPQVNDRADGGDGQQVADDDMRGIRRFLYLALHDQEDEWDSDELDEDF